LKAIDRAISGGDATTAFNLRSQFAPVLPGSAQNYIDDTLHSQSMVQTGQQSIAALKSGQSLPECWWARLHGKCKLWWRMRLILLA